MIKFHLKLFLIIMLIFCFFFSPSSIQAMEYYFCGLDLKNINSKKALMGAALSLVTHTIGHLLCLEIQDKDWKIEIEDFVPVKYSLDPLSDEEGRWFARSGFLLQHIIGLSLIHFQKTKNSNFTKGYTMFNVAHILTYPIRFRYQDEGDFFLIDRYNGSGMAEWTLYSSITLYNLSQTFPSNR